MTWSYALDLPTSKDKLRLLIGDTDEPTKQFENEELAFLIAENPNLYAAAASACRTLASRYARFADKQVGDLKLSASQRARAYHDAAAHYEERSGGTVPAVVPYAGGITVADKEIDEFDEGKVQPYFTVGAMNNPEAGGTHQTGSVTH